MNIVITDIAILSKLVVKACELRVDLAEFQFYAVQSSLNKDQRRDAMELERMGILYLDELPNSEEESFWLYQNYNPSISINELMAIRYAMINKHILLTNSQVLAICAKHHDIRMLDINDVKKQTTHWLWFKNQHIQFGKVAALL